MGTRHIGHRELRADVMPGLFASERLVRFTDKGGNVSTFLAPSNLTKERPGGRSGVVVRILEELNGYCLIELPGDSYGSGKFAAVDADMLVAI